MANVATSVITCMDFRFQDQLKGWLDDKLGQYDRSSLAGASKAFTEEEWRPAALAQVDLAHKLHGVSDVHLLDHTDCGAFGGANKHQGDLQAEIEEHRVELQAAQKIIEEAVPAVTVHLHLIDLEGNDLL